MSFKHFNHLNVPDSWERYFTKYPQGMTILEALFEWVSQVDSMVDNQNNLNDKVEQFRNEIDVFVSKFEDRLQEEVTTTLQEWQASGFIDIVISEALQWQLTDYIATNEADKASLNAQLDYIATGVKSFGAKGDGVTDDTPYINLAINYAAENDISTVYIPDGTYLVNGAKADNQTRGESGAILMKSNVFLVLSENAIIKQIPTQYNSYNIINFSNVENSGISGGTIMGERDEHLGTGGEWGYGIGVYTSKNITLENITLKDCWGDGINLKTSIASFGIPDVENRQNEDIKIINVTALNNRRQGMSIESGFNVSVYDSEFSGTNGVLPACGVDIEPAGENDIVRDVIFSRCLFRDNQENGLQIFSLFGEITGIHIEDSTFKNNLATRGQISLVGGEDVYLNNVSVNGKIYVQSSKKVALSNMKEVNQIHILGAEHVQLNNSELKSDLNSSFLKIFEYGSDISKNITLNNIKTTVVGEPIPYPIFDTLSGQNIRINNCVFNNANYLFNITNTTTVELLNSTVTDMKLELIVIRDRAKAIVKNNIFSGIGYGNPNQQMIRMKDTCEIVLSNNDFYKRNVFGGNLGEGIPVTCIRPELNTTIRGHSNFTDGMTEQIESKNASGYFPIITGA